MEQEEDYDRSASLELFKQEEDDSSYLDSSQTEFNDSQLSHENPQLPTEGEGQIKKRLGRPRGAKNGSGVRAGMCRARVTVNDMIGNPEKLPKMRMNLGTIRISVDQIIELKKVPCFFQPGVCFRIAPDLDRCKECYKKTWRNHYRVGEVECRFYQFRKLRYNGDKLEVAGFLDPLTDPIDIDRSIWMPSNEKRFKVSFQSARLILIHVGAQLCQLYQKEKIYYEKYKSSDKPIIWKRLIE